jgi:hypothetical protein
MMPPSATFNYVTVVPKGGAQAGPWQMESLETIVPTGPSLTDNRLVGWNPLLHISDGGMTPNPGPSRPAVLRSELRFVATDMRYASHSTASFFLDRALVNAMCPGDFFHMARTECGGLGASLIRQGKLVFAAGEVSAVPLGSEIQAKIPYDLITEAQAVFRHRDPKFEFPEWPIEINHRGTCRILFSGRLIENGYHIWVLHGFCLGEPGTPECVAISLEGVCNPVAASATAQLLEMEE